MTAQPKTVPRITTDEEAEAFLEQDLSGLDPAQFKPFAWERHRKVARITMRVPQPLLDALKAKAAERGIPYQRLIREAIEKAL